MRVERVEFLHSVGIALAVAEKLASSAEGGGDNAWYTFIAKNGGSFGTCTQVK